MAATAATTAVAMVVDSVSALCVSYAGIYSIELVVDQCATHTNVLQHSQSSVRLNENDTAHGLNLENVRIECEFYDSVSFLVSTSVP